MFFIQIESEFAEHSYRNYYILGVVIIIAIAGYWFIVSGSSLTEEKCVEMLSVYDPIITSANVDRSRSDIIRYTTENSRASYTSSGNNRGCLMTIFNANIVKGMPYECPDGSDFHVYAEEHSDFYEIEITPQDDSNPFTAVMFYSKTPEMKAEFELIMNGEFCGWFN